MAKLRFAIVGYGRIGKLVEQVLKEIGEHIQGTIDPIFVESAWHKNSLKHSDTAICFTSPDAGYETTKRILEAGVDAVVGTTKFYLNPDGSVNEEILEEFDRLAREKECRMLYASNFSVGMNAFWKHLRPLAETMAELEYDVAVEERHHAKKADVAGTAKTIGTILLGAYPDKEMLSLGDCERKRADDEITVVSTRAGHIPGTHTVIFDSDVDTIEFTHRVRDPKIFAKGAVDSAYWLRNKKPGVYCITDRLFIV